MINKPLISLCLATRNRASLLAQTLNSLRSQMSDDVEIVVVDGGSTDETSFVVRDFAAQGFSVRYFFYDDNAGLDRDYDRAVEHAGGEFCWLFTDDDLVREGAIDELRSKLIATTNLVVVNSAVYDHTMTRELQPTRMPSSDLDTGACFELNDTTLEFIGDTLSFIGSVVVRRSIWIERDRAPFVGSMFVHVGVLLQSPQLSGVRIVSKPLVNIRYGNASWLSRTFEIWTLLWPSLIWSFDHYGRESRLCVTPPAPWRSALYLMKQRARGAYGLKEYKAYIAPRTKGLEKAVPCLIGACPGRVVNFLATIYIVVFRGGGKLGLYDLIRSPYASTPSRYVAKFF